MKIPDLTTGNISLALIAALVGVGGGTFGGDLVNGKEKQQVTSVIEYQYNQLDRRIEALEGREILPEARAQLAAINARLELFEGEMKELRQMVLEWRRYSEAGDAS